MSKQKLNDKEIMPAGYYMKIDPVDILINVKDGILKFYTENGYIYCESIKSKERVVVGNVKA